MSLPRARDGWTVVTGGGGFVGHVLTAELLRRGHRCRLLLRGPGPAADAAVDRLLGELGLSAPELRGCGRLTTVRGGLPDDLPASAAERAERVVHCAAVVRFEADGSGEPERTNDRGTAGLLGWASSHGIGEFHLVSTAYACGRTPGATPERVVARPPGFRNAYEQSKWSAEVRTAAWAGGPGRTATIYRPSIVVGAHATGRATRFNGLYPALHAFDRCTLGEGRPAGGEPHRLPLRIEGDPAGRLNLAPVDHVAALVAAVVDAPDLQGGVYNLVDPRPMPNGEFLSIIERCFGVTGCRFEAGAASAGAFAACTRTLRPYIVESPAFERARTQALEARLGRPWPVLDEPFIRRLIEFARAAGWGRGVPTGAAPVRGGPVEEYFEAFLPERAPHSSLTSMTSLDTTFRFVVDGDPGGAWVCRFIRGRLEGVPVRSREMAVDFTYRMDADAFLDIVGARVDPQEVFLEGRAEVAGDIELALKMGVVFEQFNREHPYTPRAPGARVHSGAQRRA